MTYKKVLIVEDAADIRRLSRTILERDGWTVVEADDGETGLTVAADEQPDVIVLDIGLPGLDGLAVARRLSAGEETAGIPIVFLTALGTSLDQLRGYEAGGVDYVVKPFAPLTLTKSVGRAMRLSEEGAAAGRERISRITRLEALATIEGQRDRG